MGSVVKPGRVGTVSRCDAAAYGGEGMRLEHGHWQRDVPHVINPPAAHSYNTRHDHYAATHCDDMYVFIFILDLDTYTKPLPIWHFCIALSSYSTLHS